MTTTELGWQTDMWGKVSMVTRAASEMTMSGHPGTGRGVDRNPSVTTESNSGERNRIIFREGFPNSFCQSWQPNGTEACQALLSPV